jgi:hypothetical protein
LSVSAASFFYFFIGKLFPKFSRRYMWIPFSFYYIATVLRDKVNKESQDEVCLVSTTNVRDHFLIVYDSRFYYPFTVF